MKITKKLLLAATITGILAIGNSFAMNNNNNIDSTTEENSKEKKEENKPSFYEQHETAIWAGAGTVAALASLWLGSHFGLYNKFYERIFGPKKTYNCAEEPKPANKILDEMGKAAEATDGVVIKENRTKIQNVIKKSSPAERSEAIKNIMRPLGWHIRGGQYSEHEIFVLGEIMKQDPKPNIREIEFEINHHLLSDCGREEIKDKKERFQIIHNLFPGLTINPEDFGFAGGMEAIEKVLRCKKPFSAKVKTFFTLGCC